MKSLVIPPLSAFWDVVKGKHFGVFALGAPKSEGRRRSRLAQVGHKSQATGTIRCNNALAKQKTVRLWNFEMGVVSK